MINWLHVSEIQDGRDGSRHLKLHYDTIILTKLGGDWPLRDVLECHDDGDRYLKFVRH